MMMLMYSVPSFKKIETVAFYTRFMIQGSVLLETVLLYFHQISAIYRRLCSVTYRVNQEGF